jgi:hypothetical protein
MQLEDLGRQDLPLIVKAQNDVTGLQLINAALPARDIDKRVSREAATATTATATATTTSTLDLCHLS